MHLPTTAASLSLQIHRFVQCSSTAKSLAVHASLIATIVRCAGGPVGTAAALLPFSSENAPFVSAKWLREREIETGGRDTVEYMIPVPGLFPEPHACRQVMSLER